MIPRQLMFDRRISSLVLLLFIIVGCIVVFLTGCKEESKGAAIASSQLTPEEQGNLEILKPSIDRVVGDYAKANIALQRYTAFKNNGDEASAVLESTKYNQALGRLKAMLLNLRPAPSGPVLQVAPSLVEVTNAIVRFEQSRHELAAGPVTNSEANRLYSLAGEVYFADQRLATELNSRTPDYGGVIASTNFTAEIGFIKVDFTKGEVKVKHSWKTGPVKWSAAAGPGRGGIRTLVVQNSTTRRVFAVGGKPIEVYVQESVIRTEGSVMTITAVE